MTESVDNTRLYLSRLEELTKNWHGQFSDSLSISTGIASIEGHDNIDSVFIEADKKNVCA